MDLIRLANPSTAAWSRGLSVLTLLQFRRKYGWDESAFSSGREVEENPLGSTASPRWFTAVSYIHDTVC